MNNISQKWFCFQCFVPKKKRVQYSVLKVWNHRHLVTSVFSRQMDHSSLHLVLHLHRCWSLLKISLFWERGLWRSLCPYRGACALYTSWSFLQEPWGNHSLGRILACRRLLAYPGQKGVEFLDTVASLQSNSHCSSSIRNSAWYGGSPQQTIWVNHEWVLTDSILTPILYRWSSLVSTNPSEQVLVLGSSRCCPLNFIIP